ncbi:hypothetical protein U9M48_001031, partial [Paspalum notatum var. saurae]
IQHLAAHTTQNQQSCPVTPSGNQIWQGSSTTAHRRYSLQVSSSLRRRPLPLPSPFLRRIPVVIASSSESPGPRPATCDGNRGDDPPAMGTAVTTIMQPAYIS